MRQAFMASPDCNGSNEDSAEACYGRADAMLAERAKEE